ncbi:MAG: hypothetical protein COB02_05955 [Candidatus Cloacimonadota bacterium]|nr:MAG: hypothetical protein COB02_12135 [Candidatus Cloacimonadota bacterium]PCJ20142.1 MAG: hypothetical protein COB02_05955 [Candidatus Cloacimonadota bacterium]
MSQDLEKQMLDLYLEINEKQKKLLEIKKNMDPFEVEDYEFTNLEGKLKLSNLFGDFNELILVYNMGSKCPYCALWADEYNGVYKHLSSRAAFVVSTPDKPEVHQKLIEKNSYKFSMIQSSQSFRQKMKFETQDNKHLPGFSVFQKTNDGKIIHITKDFFGPGDLYCGVWHFFDLLPSNKEWHPSL